MKTKLDKPVTVTVSLSKPVYDRLANMCVHFGEPGVPRATMAATAIVRGLDMIAAEMGYPKKGATK